MKFVSIVVRCIVLLLVVFPAFLFAATAPAYAATSPSLGDAASFAVLAGTAVTNVPTSVITGDVGLSPAAGTNYAGLSPSEVSGTIFAVDSSGPAGIAGNNATLVNQAKTDWTSAYNALSAAGNAACTTNYGAVTQDLVGLSLGPGVYCAEGAGKFTLSGTLTLTGSGVWIFRSGSTLVTSGTANVVGGNACDVWWKVPSSATLGAGSLIGNILASTSIGMVTGVTLTGRALASTGAVTLQSNTINQSCTGLQAKVIDKGGGSTYTGGTSVCTDVNSQTITPTIIESRRVSPTSIFVSWGPYSGINTFVVRYGPTNGNWLYSTNVTGFSTTLNDLPANQPFWVEVAAKNDCSIGTYGPALLVGGPGLPNTGFAPYRNAVPWYLPAGIIVALSGLLVFIQKNHN